jgi:hypothetical protein
MRNYRKYYRRDETKNWRNSNSTNIGWLYSICNKCNYKALYVKIKIYKKPKCFIPLKRHFKTSYNARNTV